MTDEREVDQKIAEAMGASYSMPFRIYEEDGELFSHIRYNTEKEANERISQRQGSVHWTKLHAVQEYVGPSYSSSIDALQEPLKRIATETNDGDPLAEDFERALRKLTRGHIHTVEMLIRPDLIARAVAEVLANAK